MTEPAATDKGPIVPSRYACFFPQGPVWVGEPVDVISETARGTWSKTLAQIVASRENSAFSLSMTRDGQVALRLKGQEEVAASREAEAGRHVLRWSLHLAHLNAFVVLLSTFAFDIPVAIREVTLGDAFVENRVAGEYAGCVLPKWGWSRRMLEARFGKHFVMLDGKQSEDPELSRWTLRAEDVEQAFDALEKLAAQEGAIFQVAGLNKAATEYALGNFSIAVVLAWFVIERELNRRWDEALANRDEVVDGSTGERRLNAKRREVLSGREFTAHIKTQALELLSSLSHAQFKKIDDCRGFRNKAVHRDGEGLSYFEAGKAIQTARELVSETYGVPLTLSLEFGFAIL